MHIYDDRSSVMWNCAVWYKHIEVGVKGSCSLHEDGWMPLKWQHSTTWHGHALPCSCYDVNQQMHTLRFYHNNVWTYTNCYMFRPQLAHHHTVHSCIRQSLELLVISGTQNCRMVISVWIMEKDMCTVTGWSNYCAHTHLLLCTYPYP